MKDLHRSIVVGTAGHIDHGKTALVRALTGVDTDRLPEEKRRRITIDLGFASTEVAGPNGSSLRVGFVDVPGHQAFIRNMLAGTGCVDAVMLVISAIEGVKPQTEEHLAICGLLGIRHGFTVLTKVDAVNDDRIEAVRQQVEEHLRSTFLARAPVLAASAVTGAGIKQVRQALTDLTLNAALGEEGRVLRLPIDRTFVAKGFGTVVTGTLISGELKVDEWLTLQPGDRSVRVRGLRVYGGAEQRASSGLRVAANLAGVDVSAATRGHMLVSPGTLAAVDTIDAEVSLLPGHKAIKHKSRLHFHAFTADAMASASLYEDITVQSSGSTLMRLRLSRAITLVPGDRFVLRQCSPGATIGGGRVLDAHPLSDMRKADTLAWLKELREANLTLQCFHRVARRGAQGINASSLSVETGITPHVIRELVTPHVTALELIALPHDQFVTNRVLERATDSIIKRLEITGGTGVLRRAELKELTGLPDAAVDHVLDRLAASGKARVAADKVFLTGSFFGPERSVESHAWRIEKIYEQAGLAAPLPAEVAAKTGLSESEVRKISAGLLRDKTLLRVSRDGLYMHRLAIEGLLSAMAELRGQAVEVSRIKQITGLSRKYVIPLLEYLDSQRITRREGQQRIVL